MFTITNASEHIKNVQSESPSEVVWYKGKTYTFETILEVEQYTYRQDNWIGSSATGPWNHFTGNSIGDYDTIGRMRFSAHPTTPTKNSPFQTSDALATAFALDSSDERYTDNDWSGNPIGIITYISNVVISQSTTSEVVETVIFGGPFPTPYGKNELKEFHIVNSYTYKYSITVLDGTEGDYYLGYFAHYDGPYLDAWDSFSYLDDYNSTAPIIENRDLESVEVEIAYDPAITLPEKAVLVSPTPTGVTDVDGDAGLEWLDGGLGAANAATGFDLYFAGTEAGLTKIGDSLGSGTVTATPETVNDGNYEAGETYYWRVDAFNAAGTTTGDVWTYTVFSLAFPVERADDYDEDNTGVAATLGGGRYGRQLMVLGHRRIYFGAL